MKFTYGAMSSVYSIEAENKLTAYAAMVIHFKDNPQIVAIYSPEESRADMWLFATNLQKRLDEIYGGNGEFFKYLDSHEKEIREACNTIKKSNFKP